MKYYLEPKEEVLKNVASSENGLTSDEAEKRLQKNGKNKLKEAEKDGIITRILKQLADPMIIMLITAAGIQLVTTIVSGENDFVDFFIILTVVFINTILGLLQESKAENAIDSLMQMTAATSKVLRDGIIKVVKSEDLVVGDVIILEAGDAVPADSRILEAYSMKVEEAALTGESVPVTKMFESLIPGNNGDVALGDRTNMLFSGSTVVYGRGKAVIVATGMDTQMGKIAEELSQAEDEQTPLQKKMNELSHILTKLVLGICIFMVVFNLIRAFILEAPVRLFMAKNEGDFVLLDIFILAISLAVAAIPEGLSTVVTIILSIGVTSMSKRQALIRKLSAVETLGCTQIICSDKTGTLTKNVMTVTGYDSPNEKLLAKAMALCSDAKIEEGETTSKGEPTECALVNYAYTLNLPKYELETSCPRIGEAPFDSNRKMMSTVHNEDGKIIQYTKGACEIMLDRCDYILTEDGIKPVTEEVKKQVMAKTKGFADKALRVLGACYREHSSVPDNFDAENLEKHLTFIGFVGMIDPCRPEVYGAIEECKRAGIRAVMITGDHIDTAVAIGKELKIISDSSQAIMGSELDKLSDEELIELVKNVSVFARVQPEHKTRIVKPFKSQGYITAMTGDGVNDAPSIKSADIGIGMGITGTDVTKGVADMVLADDNFATIVNAVSEGRKIYDNVKKVIQFQLSTNMSEVLVVFIQSLLGFNILSATHLLWVNMVTDCTPGLSLGMEKAEPDVMDRPVRNPKEGVFANGAWLDTIIQGIYMAAVVLVSFFIGNSQGIDGLGETMAFVTVNFTEMFHAVTMRSQQDSIFKLKNINWWMVGSIVLTSILTIGVTLIPLFEQLFDFVDMGVMNYLWSILLAVSVIVFIEIEKAVKKIVMKKIKK